MIFTAPFLPAWHSTMSAPPPWPATPPTCVERHCHETAAAPIDGVAATRQRVDAIFPKLKFGKRKKRTPSQHEVPVPDAAGLRRRVLEEVDDLLELERREVLCGNRPVSPVASMTDDDARI